MEQDISVNPLTDLHQLLGDSVKGYKEASEKMETPVIASFLADLADERNRMKQQLRTGILHVDPQQKLDEGTLKGDLHRAWIAIREALSKSTDHFVLDECARGEKYLSDRYSTVLEDKATPPATLPLLREQASKVAVTRSTIDTLSRTTKEVKDKA